MNGSPGTTQWRTRTPRARAPNVARARAEARARLERATATRSIPSPEEIADAYRDAELTVAAALRPNRFFHQAFFEADTQVAADDL